MYRLNTNTKQSALFIRTGMKLALVSVSLVGSGSLLAQSVSIMPMGDSITEGLNACSYRTPLVESFGNCSVSMVGSDNAPLAFNGGTVPSNCITTNIDHEGHSGYSTANFMDTTLFNGVTRVRYWTDLENPNNVLLHIGSNDMSNTSGSFPVGEYDPGTNTGTFTIGRISSMVDEIYAASPGARIYVADLIPWYDPPAAINTRIGELRVELAFMVNDRAADGDAIETVVVSAGYQQSMMQPDNIHPNATGERHIAEQFARALHQDNICAPMPDIQTPVASTLQGAVETFTWTQDNMDASYIDEWQLRAGSSPNSSNYGIASGTGSSTQATLAGLPTNGQTIHVTVRVRYFTGVWFTDSRVYTAATIGGSDFCNGQAVTVYIGNGDSATSGNDVILGTSGSDIINAFGGNDTICAEGGADVVNGGSGDDTIFGGNGNDVLSGQGGNDTLYGDSDNDTLNGGTGNDTLYGGTGNDDLRGQSGADIMWGEDGVDQFFGGSGNDEIHTGPGGNLGTAQVVRGNGNNDTIFGSDSADLLEGGPGLDEIHGGAGNDTLRGGGATDTLFGDAGNDTLEGNAQRDFLYGGSDNDTLIGGTGNDDLFGDSGTDSLSGQSGIDLCDGGSGGSDTATSTCETVTNVP